jgi:hypothetical protein
VLGRRRDAHLPSDRQRLPLIAGLKLGQFIGVLLDQICHPPEQARTSSRRHPTPAF